MYTHDSWGNSCIGPTKSRFSCIIVIFVIHEKRIVEEYTKITVYTRKNTRKSLCIHGSPRLSIFWVYTVLPGCPFFVYTHAPKLRIHIHGTGVHILSSVYTFAQVVCTHESSMCIHICIHGSPIVHMKARCVYTFVYTECIHGSPIVHMKARGLYTTSHGG